MVEGFICGVVLGLAVLVGQLQRRSSVVADASWVPGVELRVTRTEDLLEALEGSDVDLECRRCGAPADCLMIPPVPGSAHVGEAVFACWGCAAVHSDARVIAWRDDGP